jgi:alcohol dehydrogenase class IV
MNFYMSTKIVTGSECMKKNSALLKTLGERCMIVTGSSSAKKSGALDDVMSVLNENSTEFIIYDKIQQNPTVASCFEAGKIARDFHADYIIGIGGGSPLDASKAVAVAAANENISEEILYKLAWSNKPLPIIAVGTTAGTGSEVTSVAVLTNGKGFKKSIRHPELYPCISFGDAKYTVTLSDSFTRSTAVDAFAHCIESYFNRSANDISKTFALAGVKKLITEFEKIDSCGTESLTYDDRENLYNASLYGGLAISITGTAFPHALGYFLTEIYNVPHGTACAVFIPEFIDYNSNIVPELSDEFFNEIGMDRNKIKKLIKKITGQCNVSLNEEDIIRLSPRWDNNGSLKRNWGNINAEFINGLLKRIFDLN